jgi:two-component system, NtrC family, response regulator PilR
VTDILVIDDEISIRDFLEILFEGDGYSVLCASGVKDGLAAIDLHHPKLVYCDLRLQDGSGMDVLAKISQERLDTQIVMMTAFATTENAVDAMQRGAYDYQLKPLKIDEIRALTAKALEKYRLLQDNRMLSTLLEERRGLSSLMGHSSPMLMVKDLIEKVAPGQANVLIEGESGTGKELIARALHQQSSRRQSPFVAVNCGAIPETLIEAELFGHAAGAFTGATTSRGGLFEAANQGTLLLDEIGELPKHMQVSLLRVIQDRALRRIGEDKERKVDIRIVAATNRDLQQDVKDGRFREDLFYRLNVIRIRVPPLRERFEDVHLLSHSFLERFSRREGKEIVGFADDVASVLLHYRYPGNVRELENIVERAVTLSESSEIKLADLPDEVVRLSSDTKLRLPLPPEGLDLVDGLEQIEREYIRQALDCTGGVKTQAAELLGLSFRSFRYRVQKLGLAEADDLDDTTSS